jgi:hypothetical protein
MIKTDDHFFKNICKTCDIHVSYPWKWLEVRGGSQRIAPLTLNLSEWSASCLGCFTPKKTVSHYPLNMRLGGAQNWSRHFGEEKNLLPMPGIKP